MWPELRAYEGQWIAVVGETIADSDRSLEELGTRARQIEATPLFAFVTYEPMV